MDLPTYTDEYRARKPHPLAFVGFVVILAASAAFLYAVSGPPHLPTRWPSWIEILVTLQGSEPPLDALAYAFTTVAWLMWIWIAASLLLRLVVVGAEAVSRGAAWARSLRAATDRFTLPIVRRVVDGAVVAIVVVNLVGRAPTASAAPLHDPTVLVASASPRHQHQAPLQSPRQPMASPGEAAYTVQTGDTLWTISQHFYGTGEEFPRLVDANVGHRMPDGRMFTRAGVIQPGWVLQVPLPSQTLQTSAGYSVYVVEKGDTLRGIAARFLGDENRWPAIFDLNRGKARLPDGRTLTNPDLIWPGLRLRLPVAEQDPQPTPAPATVLPRTSPPITEPDRRDPPPPPAPQTVPVTPPTTTIRAPLPTPRPTIPAVASAPPIRNGGPSFTTSALTYGAIGIAAAAAAGAGLILRRRFRRSLDEPSDETTPPPIILCNDFAEAELARSLAHRLQSGEVEPVEAITTRAMQFLRERRVEATLMLVRQARGTTSLMLAMGLREESELDELAEDLGKRLGGQGLATTTTDHDVLLKLSGLKLATLGIRNGDSAGGPIWLLPVGMVSARETMYANWRELGNVLVAGQPAGGTDVVLTTIVAALAARCRPDELRLRTIAYGRGLPTQLATLPHQDIEVIDPDDTRGVARALQDVRAELLRRMARSDDDARIPWRPTADEPALMVLIDELAEVEDDGTTLELLGTHGPLHGIQLLAGTTRARDVGEDLLVHFRTRIILQSLDDDDSIRLLGRPDAADLGSAEFLLWIDGRIPLRARGFRVPESHLDELMDLIHEAYSRPSVSSVATGSKSSDETEVRVLAIVGGASENEEARTADSTPIADSGTDITSPAVSPEGSGSSNGSDPSLPPRFDDLDRIVDRAVRIVAHQDDDADSASTLTPRAADRVATIAPEQTTCSETLPPPSDAVGAGDAIGEIDLPVTPGDPIASDVAASDGSRRDAPEKQRVLVEIRCLGGFEVTSGDRKLSPTGDRGNSYKA